MKTARLFGDKESKELWCAIDEAKNIRDMRRALYMFGGEIQKSEERYNKLRGKNFNGQN